MVLTKLLLHSSHLDAIHHRHARHICLLHHVTSFSPGNDDGGSDGNDKDKSATDAGDDHEVHAPLTLLLEIVTIHPIASTGVVLFHTALIGHALFSRANDCVNARFFLHVRRALHRGALLVASAALSDATRLYLEGFDGAHTSDALANFDDVFACRAANRTCTIRSCELQKRLRVRVVRAHVTEQHATAEERHKHEQICFPSHHLQKPGAEQHSPTMHFEAAHGCPAATGSSPATSHTLPQTSLGSQHSGLSIKVVRIIIIDRMS